MSKAHTIIQSLDEFQSAIRMSGLSFTFIDFRILGLGKLYAEGTPFPWPGFNIDCSM